MTRKVYLPGLRTRDLEHELLELEDDSGYWLFEDGNIIAMGDLAKSVPPVLFGARTFKVIMEAKGMSRRAISTIDPQGVDSDTIPYTCYLPTGTSPSAVTVKAWDINPDGTYTDVTSTVMPSGSVTTSGDVITTKPLTALTLGHSYRVIVAFTAAGVPMSNYFDVIAEK
jgi:hypothetical protein